MGEGLMEMQCWIKMRGSKADCLTPIDVVWMPFLQLQLACVREDPRLLNRHLHHPPIRLLYRQVATWGIEG